MSAPEHPDGPIEDILATSPDLDAIGVDVKDLAEQDWAGVDDTVEGGADLDVFLRAAALVRSGARDLVQRVRLLEQVADGRLQHTYRGSCPDRLEGPNVRDLDCRVCQILGAPRP